MTFLSLSHQISSLPFRRVLIYWSSLSFAQELREFTHLRTLLLVFESQHSLSFALDLTLLMALFFRDTLANVEEMVNTLEFTAIEKKVFESLKLGSQTLKELQKEVLLSFFLPLLGPCLYPDPTLTLRTLANLYLSLPVSYVLSHFVHGCGFLIRSE